MASGEVLSKVVALLEIFLVVGVHSGPTGFSKTFPHQTSSCALACTAKNDPTKFQYDSGTTYVYEFTSDIETLVLGETAEKSRLRVTSTAEINVLSRCDFSIQLKGVQLSDRSQPLGTSENGVKHALEKHLLKFSFQDGQIEQLCPHPEEPGWVVNVKRGILSMFHNTMEDWDYDGIVSETDIHGKCPTQYTQSTTPSWGGSHSVTKIKDLSSCTQRRHHLSSIQSIPYSSSTPQPNVLSGTVECTQTILQGKIERVECHEEQIFKPFDHADSGARNVITQTIRLITTRASAIDSSVDAGVIGTRKSSLIFESDTTSFETSRDLTQVFSLLKELESKTIPNVETEAPLLFRELITALRTLDEVALRSLLTKVVGVTDNPLGRILFNALQSVGTAPSLKIMTELYLGGGLSSELAQSWLSSVTFIKYPTAGMISAVMPLLQTDAPTVDVLLSVSGLMNSYCRTIPDCATDKMIQEAARLMASPLERNSCHFPEDDPNLREGVIALKALGNLGVYPDLKNQILQKCFTSGKNSIEIRLSAMDAHRRVACSAFSADPFLRIYADYKENTEVRIQAYLIVMKCANRKVLETVEKVLKNEVVNQVGSFVWTHLTNYQETNRPDKEIIRNLVSNEILQNKFQTDARKFSRNYENSIFSDEYKLGLGLDSNIIFTEDSFLPKSGMTNLSVQLFGETVNLFEFGGRFNSPETLLEPIFGPGGYFPDESMSTFLKSTRQKRDTSTKLARLDSIRADAASNLDPSPRGSIYTRIFGHETFYKEFDVNTESSIPNVVDDEGKKWFNVKNILENLSTGKKLDFTRSTTLLDVDYSVPTISGIPLTLSFLAGSTVGLKAEGKFNVGKFIERKEIELYGLLRPNVAINLDASLTVRLGPGNKFIRSGLSIRNVLRSSTGFETRLEINGISGVKGVFNVPQKRQEILEASSKLVFLQASGTEKTVAKSSPSSMEEQSCLENSNFLGLKLCGELSLPNEFTVTPHSAVVRLYLEKTDDFDSYTIDYSLNRHPFKTEFSLLYDTPGSKVDRKTELKFTKESTTGIYHVSVKTPTKLGDAAGTFTSNLKSLHVTVIDGKDKVVQLNGSLAFLGGKITPNFFLEIYQKPVAELKGSIQLPTGSDDSEGSVDISLKHVTQNPIRLQGNYVGKDDGSSELTVGVESYHFTGSLHSNLKSRPNHWSSRSTLEYSWKHGDINVIDISAKVQKVQKGALSKLSAAASLVTSSYPDQNLDFSWEILNSAGFCENIVKLSLGKSTWDAHTIYSLQNTRDLTELRFLVALSNPRDDLDYTLEFTHRMVDHSITTRFTGRISPVTEVKVNFQYDTVSKPFLSNNLTAGITWPGAEYFVTFSLLEKRRGEFDSEIVISLNNFREMKATISYLNNSNNLKLDHSIEFRARGFFSVPISGNVGFTVTDKQSHVGCQVLLEGKKPYSSRLSTSVDYSHVRNMHKIEAKVTFNEKKYSSEVVFGQGSKKSGTGQQFLTVDLFLNQHIFIEGKMSGSLLNKITASLLLIPDKVNAPLEKLDLSGTLSRKSMSLDLNYFGDKFGISGGLGGGRGEDDTRTLNAQVVWGLDKKITISSELSTLTRSNGFVSLQLSTPFQDVQNLTLFWIHTIKSDQWLGKLSGSLGQKSILVQLGGAMTPQNVEITGILDISGYSRCDLNLALSRSLNRDNLTASFSRGVDQSSLILERKYASGGNVTGLNVKINGFKYMPEISILWDTTTDPSIGKHASKLHLDWGQAKSSSLHLDLNKDMNPPSYQVSFLTPFPTWKSSSARVTVDHGESYTFSMTNEADLSLIPTQIHLFASQSSPSFNHSALVTWTQTPRSEIGWSISGHLGGFDSTKIEASLKTSTQNYSAHIRSELDHDGVRLLQLSTDLASYKSELGVALKNTNTREITAWTSYLSGREEKRATFSLLRDDSQVNKVSLLLTENTKPLLHLDADLVWIGFTKFWSVSSTLKSNLALIPSLTFESSHNMLDMGNIVNVNHFLVSPMKSSFWEGLLPTRNFNFSSQTVLTNMENLYSSVTWGSESLTVAGGLHNGNDFKFDISSTAFTPLQGNIFYARSDNSVTIKSVIVRNFTEKVIDLSVKASSKGKEGTQFVGSLSPSKYFRGVEAKFLLDKETRVLETYLISDKNYVFFLNTKGQATLSQGFFKLTSKSEFFPSIDKHNLDTRYQTGQDGDVTVTLKYTNGYVTHHVETYGVWGSEKRIRITSEGDFMAGVEIHLQNFRKLSLTASHEGRKVCQVEVNYDTKLSTFSYGEHLVEIEVTNQNGNTHRGTISVGLDPKKVDFSVTTPFPNWSKVRLYWDIDVLAGIKSAKFGVHKEADKLDCIFDMKSNKRTNETTVYSEINIVGFKSIRNILFEDYLKLDSLTTVEGNFSALAKWSQSGVQVQFKTPLERYQNLKFTGKYENKRVVRVILVTCDINERHHEFKTSLKTGPNKLDAEFDVKCVHSYKGKLSLDYLNRLNFDLEGPSGRWGVNGHWTETSLTVAATTPVTHWKKVLLEAKYEYVSPLRHSGSVSWTINDAGNSVGYNFRQDAQNVTLLITTPLKSWEEVNITLTSSNEDYTFIAKKSDHQEIRVVVKPEIVGSLSNLSSDAGLTLLVRVTSPFQEYREMRLLTQYDRVGGEHTSTVEYSRNEHLVKLKGHFLYNQQRPHAIDLQVDLSSFQNYSSKVQATLSIDPSGNNSFIAVVEFNQAKHEVHAALDLSDNNTVFGLKTTLSFLQRVQISFKNEDKKKVNLHGLWEGSGQVLDVTSILVGSGWSAQRLNLSIISPFAGLRHIFLYADFKLSPDQVGSSFLFENEDSRWLGKLEGGGLHNLGLNGTWNLQVNTPIRGYQDVGVKLSHTWRPDLKSLLVEVDANSERLVDMKVSLTKGELAVAFDSLIFDGEDNNVSTHANIKWGSGVMIELTARAGRETQVDVNIHGFSSGMLHLSSQTFPEVTSRIAWKVDGTLDDGNVWATLTNHALGSRSIRSAWRRDKDWKRVKFETWLRNDNDTENEIGGLGEFIVTQIPQGYKVQVNGNWALEEEHSFSVNTKFTRKEVESPPSSFHYFGEIVAESTITLFQTFSTSGNVTVTTGEGITAAVTSIQNGAQFLSLHTNLIFTLPQSRISVKLNAPQVVQPFQLEAAYNISSEVKSVLVSFSRGDDDDSLVILTTKIITPKSRQEVEFVFNLNSNLSSLRLEADGVLKGSYRHDGKDGKSHLNVILTSEKLGNYDFSGALRPTSDFFVELELTPREPRSNSMTPLRVSAFWRGNLLQRITSSVSLHVKEFRLNGNLSMTRDSVRASFSTPWMKDVELEGFAILHSTPKEFEVKVTLNEDRFKISGNCNVSPSWDGIGDIIVAKNGKTLAALKFGLEAGNLVISGAWNDRQVQVQGKIVTLENSTWLENGRINVILLLDSREQFSLECAHKFVGDEHLLNVTTKDGKSVKIHVTKRDQDNYVVSANLQWNSDNRMKFLIDVNPNKFDIFFSSPYTSELALHGMFDSTASHTTLEGFLIYDTQRSTGLLHTTRNNDSVQFNMSLELPALHQRVATTMLIQSGNDPHAKSGGDFRLNVNGHQFSLTGELVHRLLQDGNKKTERESSLSLSVTLPVKGMKPIGTKVTLIKSMYSMQHVQFDGSVTFSGETGSLSAGYHLPSQDNNQSASVTFMVRNNIKKFPTFTYGVALSGSPSLKNVSTSILFDANSVTVNWNVNLPDVSASVKLSLPSWDDDTRANHHYHFDLGGHLNPTTRVFNVSLNMACRERNLIAGVTSHLESDGITGHANLFSSSHHLDYRYRLYAKKKPGNRYELELSSLQDTISLDFVADVTTSDGENITANGKMTGSFGSLFGRLDYSKNTENGHEVSLSLESASLISGKKVIIRGELSPQENGFQSKIQCRTRTGIHTGSLSLSADASTGFDVKFGLLSPQQMDPLNLQVSWRKDGSKFEGLVRANFDNVTNEVETFLDVTNLEGRVKIVSPLIPSSRFDVHLKALFSSDEIDILGDVHIREYHWRCEGALKYQSWRDMVVMLQLLTPLKSFDRLTIALKLSDDEIYGEIYTPLVPLPKAMVKVSGFKAIQERNWDDLRPAISVGLPIGKYSVSGIYTKPSSSTPGKVHLFFEDGTLSPVQTYHFTAEISPLSSFSFNMNEPGRISASLQIPALPRLDFSAEGRVRGRTLISLNTHGTLANKSVTFSFDYNNDNGSPTIAAKLSSPFEMYENVALSLAFDTFQKIGQGRSLHMVLQNPDWMDDITLTADYRYQYGGFLTLDGELNAVLDSFMDIPALHFALETDTESGGFSGVFNTKIGNIPGSLKIDVGLLSEESATLLVNGTLGEEDNAYTLFTKVNLHRGQDNVLFSSEIYLLDQSLLVTRSTFSTKLDAAGANLELATPWGPIHLSFTLIPILPLISERQDFSMQQLLTNSNATLHLEFNEERVLGVQFITNEAGVAVLELFNPIAPISLILSVKRVTKSSLFLTGEFCWDLDNPVGNTMGGRLTWDRGLFGQDAGLSLALKEIGNVEAKLSHSLTSLSLNQTILVKWESPFFQSVGQSGYHLIVTKGSSLLKYKNYGTFLQLDLPWRSLSIDVLSNDHPDEFVASALLKWDALRDPSKSLGVKWSQDIKAAWRMAEITDFFELTHPLGPNPVVISTERIYRNGHFQLVEVQLNGSDSPENAVTISIFRNNTSWANSRSIIRHNLSNMMISFRVKTSEDNGHSTMELSYMDVSRVVRNLTVNLVSSEDAFEMVLFSSSLDHKSDVILLKNHRYQDLTTINCRFLSYDVDAMILTSLPFLEINVKHKGADKLNVFGGYSHKKKIGGHVARVELEKFDYFFKTTAELTPTNVLTAKVTWLPDLFSNLLELKIPTEISSSIFNDIDSFRILQGVQNELEARWEKQISPEVREYFAQFKSFVGNEAKKMYQEGVDVVRKIAEFYEADVFYVKSICEHFQISENFRENVWNVLVNAWNKLTASISSLIPQTLELYENCGGRLETLVMTYWEEISDLVESIWQENLNLVSSTFTKIWDASKSLLNLLEGKIDEIEEKLMAVGLFRKFVEIYKDYATWFEEIPFQEFTKKIEDMLNIRIWDRLSHYVEPFLSAIRGGLEIEYFTDLLQTPPLPFIRSSLSNFRSVVSKFWQVLEIESRLKSIVRASLHNFDRIIHRYLPTSSWNYDLDQGFIQLNQSLSAIQWSDFTTTPRWRTTSEDVQDVSQLTNFYYQVLDTVESLKPVFDLNLRTILPPFTAYALMAGDYHYFTFDKRYFRFVGECSYLLVSDLSQSTDPFSLIVNYDNRNGVIRKKSYALMVNQSSVEIEVTDFKVTVNGKKVELPLNIGSTFFLRRHQTGLELYDTRGFTMTCSLSFTVCTVSVSGWHFGKLGGILGTYDNEPSNDLVGPDGQEISDVSAFAYSWRVGRNSGLCRMKNFAKDEAQIVVHDVDDICHNLLINRSSPLRPCFNTVDSTIYMEMCEYDVSKNVNSANRVESACPAMNAYVTECQKNNVDVWMPPTCVRCRLENGDALTTGENATLQTNGDVPPPQSSDNVILIQEAACISPPSILSEAIKRLDLALQAEGLRNNRYAIVGFGGSGARNQPHVKTTSANVWTHNTLFKIPNDTISTTTNATGPSSNLYDAIHYAASLGFRAGVSKNFISVTCGDEDCGDWVRYADVLTLLVENDIKLHMLVPKQFTLKGSSPRKDETNQIYGMDMNGVYTTKHAKHGLLDADPVLKRQINVPKDLCTPLAMESNGTRFNVEQATKKVLDVWSRRVAQTSHPSSCQRCECVPDRFGSASIMCHQCVSPSLWKFMEEWKSYQNLDGEEFPVELIDHGGDFIMAT